MLVGLARLAVGLLRAGEVTYLISHPMLLGFMPAAALLIVGSQLPTAVGATAEGDGIIDRAGWTVTHPAAWQMPSLLLAAGAVVLVLAGRRVPVVPLGTRRSRRRRGARQVGHVRRRDGRRDPRGASADVAGASGPDGASAGNASHGGPPTPSSFKPRRTSARVRGLQASDAEVVQEPTEQPDGFATAPLAISRVA